MMKEIFKIQRGKYTGDDWCMSFGRSMIDNKDYTITTNRVHASELSQWCVDAKDDAELICKLLNAYYNKKIEFKI